MVKQCYVILNRHWCNLLRPNICVLSFLQMKEVLESSFGYMFKLWMNTLYSVFHFKNCQVFLPHPVWFFSKWWLFPRQHKLFSPCSGDFSVSWGHGYLIIREFSFKGLIKSWWCVKWWLAYSNLLVFFFNMTTLLQQVKGECGQILLPKQKCHYQPQDYRYYYNNITPSSAVTFCAI